MKDQIDLQPIIKFNKRYSSAVTSKSKEIRLTIEEASLLASALSSLLSLNVSEFIELSNNIKTQNNDSIPGEPIEIRMDAGSFK